MSFVYDNSHAEKRAMVEKPAFSLTAPLKRLGKHMRRVLYASNGKVAMDKDSIHYDTLMQEALRSIVRKVLQQAADFGLPGEHHFFVGFQTTAPGVQVSDRVKAKYPEEMTIVLQHQFWDLEADEMGFSVGLSFGGVPEMLVVPYSALTSFFDPSVSFGLRFSDNDDGDEIAEQETTTVERLEGLLKKDDIEAASTEKKGEKSSEKAHSHSSADVVSLDAFRKKDSE